MTISDPSNRETAPALSDAAARIEKFLTEHAKRKGVHPEILMGLNTGDDTREAELTVSDLHAVLKASGEQRPAALSELTDAELGDAFEAGRFDKSVAGLYAGWRAIIKAARQKRERAITGEPVAPKAWGYHTWDWDTGKYALRGIVKPLPNCGACPGDGSICTASCRLADESPPIDRAAPITGETSRDVAAKPRVTTSPVIPFDDPRVKIVYDVLCDDVSPPDPDEHWEGFAARRIVEALAIPNERPEPDYPIDSGDGLMPRDAVSVLSEAGRMIDVLRAIIKCDDDAIAAKGKPNANLNGYGLVDLFDCVGHPFGAGKHKLQPYRSVALDVALTDARAVIGRAALADPSEVTCDHSFIDMANEVIVSGNFCTKCGAVRTVPSEGIASVAASELFSLDEIAQACRYAEVSDGQFESISIALSDARAAHGQTKKGRYV